MSAHNTASTDLNRLWVLVQETLTWYPHRNALVRGSSKATAARWVEKATGQKVCKHALRRCLLRACQEGWLFARRQDFENGSGCWVFKPTVKLSRTRYYVRMQDRGVRLTVCQPCPVCDRLVGGRFENECPPHHCTDKPLAVILWPKHYSGLHNVRLAPRG